MTDPLSQYLEGLIVTQGRHAGAPVARYPAHQKLGFGAGVCHRAVRQDRTAENGLFDHAIERFGQFLMLFAQGRRAGTEPRPVRIVAL